MHCKERRNELELAVRAKGLGKLETVQAWYVPPTEEILDKILKVSRSQ
jgi:hypothetical protein